MSLLIWYKMFCMRDISYRLIWMKYINMLSVYAQSGTHRPFNELLRFLPRTLLFWCVEITDVPKLWRKYVETWVFVAVSGQWPLGKNIRGWRNWPWSWPWIFKVKYGICYILVNKSGVKRLNTLGHLDQYMAQHGRIVKQSYCETVLVTILFNSNKVMHQ